MRDGQSSPEPGDRPAERARRVALDDQQIRPLLKRLQKRAGDVLDVPVRIGRARAMELRRVAVAKTVIGGIEAGMLPGDNQRGLQVEAGERAGDGRQLDRFGPGADDQPDIRATQISP